MRFSETFFVVLHGLFSLSMAAPTSYEYEDRELEAEERTPGFAL